MPMSLTTDTSDDAEVEFNAWHDEEEAVNSNEEDESDSDEPNEEEGAETWNGIEDHD